MYKSMFPHKLMCAGVLITGLTAATAFAETMVSEGHVPETTGVTKTDVITGLDHPWGIAWLPNGDKLITERDGALRLVRDGALVETPISGVPEVLEFGQGGLMDVALHPDFADNNLVYLTYTAGTRDANRTTVARGTLDGMTLTDVETIFEVSQAKEGPQHFGSRLLWLPDGTLLVSIGDGGNPPTELEGQLIRLFAQDLSSHIGKVIRINDDGSVPRDNPFVGDESAAPEVWSYGHRNIQGMAMDTETGAIWTNEHGALRGDELNLMQPGGNYGWPSATYSKDYRGATEISPHTSLPGMIDPLVVWMDTQAPSGLVIYRGDVFSDWNGDIFSGGLASNEIRHIEVDENGNAVAEQTIMMDDRVRDVRQGPDGYIYVLTDDDEGRLVRLSPAD